MRCPHKALRWVEDDAAARYIDLPDRRIDGRDEEIAAVVSDDVNVVCAGLQHLDDAAERVPASVEGLEADDLEAVVLTFLQRAERFLRHLEQQAAQLAG
jgi:hypothetical protein